jgi:hypothetical protein
LLGEQMEVQFDKSKTISWHLSILFSFNSTRSNVTINNIIMINVNHGTKTKQNFDATNETINVIIILNFTHSFLKWNLVSNKSIVVLELFSCLFLICWLCHVKLASSE